MISIESYKRRLKALRLAALSFSKPNLCQVRAYTELLGAKQPRFEISSNRSLPGLGIK